MSKNIESDSDVDIYGDLPIFSAENTIAELENAKKTLENEMKILKLKFNEIEIENKKLKTENEALGVNISSLYKTAAGEIKRKDHMIQELRKENEDIIFRHRRNRGRNPSRRPEEVCIIEDDQPVADHPVAEKEVFTLEDDSPYDNNSYQHAADEIELNVIEKAPKEIPNTIFSRRKAQQLKLKNKQSDNLTSSVSKDVTCSSASEDLEIILVGSNTNKSTLFERRKNQQLKSHNEQTGNSKDMGITRLPVKEDCPRPKNSNAATRNIDPSKETHFKTSNDSDIQLLVIKPKNRKERTEDTISHLKSKEHSDVPKSSSEKHSHASSKERDRKSDSYRKSSSGSKSKYSTHSSSCRSPKKIPLSPRSHRSRSTRESSVSRALTNLRSKSQLKEIVSQTSRRSNERVRRKEVQNDHLKPGVPSEHKEREQTKVSSTAEKPSKSEKGHLKNTNLPDKASKLVPSTAINCKSASNINQSFTNQEKGQKRIQQALEKSNEKEQQIAVTANSLKSREENSIQLPMTIDTLHKKDVNEGSKGCGTSQMESIMEMQTDAARKEGRSKVSADAHTLREDVVSDVPMDCDISKNKDTGEIPTGLLQEERVNEESANNGEVSADNILQSEGINVVSKASGMLLNENTKEDLLTTVKGANELLAADNESTNQVPTSNVTSHKEVISDVPTEGATSSEVPKGKSLSLEEVLHDMSNDGDLTLNEEPKGSDTSEKAINEVLLSESSTCKEGTNETPSSTDKLHKDDMSEMSSSNIISLEEAINKVPAVKKSVTTTLTGDGLQKEDTSKTPSSLKSHKEVSNTVSGIMESFTNTLTGVDISKTPSSSLKPLKNVSNKLSTASGIKKSCYSVLEGDWLKKKDFGKDPSNSIKPLKTDINESLANAVNESVTNILTSVGLQKEDISKTVLAISGIKEIVTNVLTNDNLQNEGTNESPSSCLIPLKKPRKKVSAVSGVKESVFQKKTTNKTASNSSMPRKEVHKKVSVITEGKKSAKILTGDVLEKETPSSSLRLLENISNEVSPINVVIQKENVTNVLQNEDSEMSMNVTGVSFNRQEFQVNVADAPLQPKNVDINTTTANTGAEVILDLKKNVEKRNDTSDLLINVHVEENRLIKDGKHSADSVESTNTTKNNQTVPETELSKKDISVFKNALNGTPLNVLDAKERNNINAGILGKHYVPEEVNKVCLLNADKDPLSSQSAAESPVEKNVTEPINKACHNPNDSLSPTATFTKGNVSFAIVNEIGCFKRRKLKRISTNNSGTTGASNVNKGASDEQQGGIKRSFEQMEMENSDSLPVKKPVQDLERECSQSGAIKDKPQVHFTQKQDLKDKSVGNSEKGSSVTETSALNDNSSDLEEGEIEDDSEEVAADESKMVASMVNRGRLDKSAVPSETSVRKEQPRTYLELSRKSRENRRKQPGSHFQEAARGNRDKQFLPTKLFSHCKRRSPSELLVKERTVLRPTKEKEKDRRSRSTSSETHKRANEFNKNERPKDQTTERRRSKENKICSARDEKKDTKDVETSYKNKTILQNTHVNRQKDISSVGSSDRDAQRSHKEHITKHNQPATTGDCKDSFKTLVTNTETPRPVSKFVIKRRKVCNLQDNASISLVNISPPKPIITANNSSARENLTSSGSKGMLPTSTAFIQTNVSPKEIVASRTSTSFSSGVQKPNLGSGTVNPGSVRLKHSRESGNKALIVTGNSFKQDETQLLKIASMFRAYSESSSSSSEYENNSDETWNPKRGRRRKRTRKNPKTDVTKKQEQ